MTEETGVSQHTLTPLQKEILRLLAIGYSHREVGAQLQVETDNVAAVKAVLMQRLALRNRIDMLHFAQAQGWVSPDRYQKFSPQPND